MNPRWCHFELLKPLLGLVFIAVAISEIGDYLFV
jgi:hypothetical protein